MDQIDPWGQPVKIAARLDLTGMDTKNLYLYSYDKKTNIYKRIEKPADQVDKNGYLHFTTELAGDIIISEGRWSGNNFRIGDLPYRAGIRNPRSALYLD